MNNLQNWSLEFNKIFFGLSFSNCFDEEKINLVEKLSGSLQPGVVGKNKLVDTNFRSSKISWITPSDESATIYQFLTDVIHNVNNDFYGFDLTEIEHLQYTVYEKNEFYNKHVDIPSEGYGRYIRKLSFSIQLSDSHEYDGGDLLVHSSVDPIVGDRGKGSITFFPSYTLHEVTPITRGVRKSLVGWVRGPLFK